MKGAGAVESHSEFHPNPNIKSSLVANKAKGQTNLNPDGSSSSMQYLKVDRIKGRALDDS